jgi:sulfhydrogenase subunit alpha
MTFDFWNQMWIETHALHIYMLAPDFVAGQMVSTDCEALERCLRLKRVGEDLVAALHSSAKHPINIAVGGFHQAPKAYELADLRPELVWTVEASMDILRFVSAFDFPKFDIEYLDYEMVCLHHAIRYPMNEGHVISSRGLVVPVSQYEAHFSQRDLSRNAVIQSVRIPRETSYPVGPLARINMSVDQLSPTARRQAETCGVKWPSGNIFYSIVARAIESIHACEEAIAIIDEYYGDLPVSLVKAELKAGRSCYAAEVPSGLTYHRYRVDPDGLIADAKIVSPGAQNQKQAE